MSLRRVVAFSFVCFSLSFAAALTGAQMARAPISLRVVDSMNIEAVWDPMAEYVTVYSVEVRSGSIVDTLTDIVTPLPLAVGTDTVVGLHLKRLKATEGARERFVFSLSSRRLWTRLLPSDVYYIFSDVVISPDGRYIAYVGQDSSGTYPIVRHFRTEAVVARGPGGGGCECDSDRNHARWITADSIEIAVAHHVEPESDWLLFAGRPSLGRFEVSRLKDRPPWH